MIKLLTTLAAGLAFTTVNSSAALLFTLNKNTGSLDASGSITLLAADTAHNSVEFNLPDGNQWMLINDAGSTLSSSSTNSYTDYYFESGSTIKASISGGGLLTNAVFDFDTRMFANNRYFGLVGSDGKDYPILAVGATLTLSGTAQLVASSDTDALIVGSHVSGYNRDTITLNVVPEPSSTVLLGLGALGLVIRRKR